MINDRNLRFIINIFGKDYEVANKDKGEIMYHCPFCPKFGKRNDDRKMYVNTNNLRYNCFRCESHGSLNSSISKDFDDVDILKVFGDYFSSTDKDDEESTYYPIPKMLLIEDLNSDAYKYMKSRGFTDQDMFYYSMRLPGILDEGFLGRVVVPNEIVSNNWTDMYIARSFVGHFNRYKNPYSSKKSSILFNYHRIPDNPEVMILNEGPLNSIIAGTNSVASFGKILSNDQRDLIIKKNPKHLYVSYDTDAKEYAIKACTSIISRSNIHVHLVQLPEVWDPINNKMKGLDAVDLGRDKYLEIVHNTPEFINSRVYDIINSILN